MDPRGSTRPSVVGDMSRYLTGKASTRSAGHQHIASVTLEPYFACHTSLARARLCFPDGAEEVDSGGLGDGAASGERSMVEVLAAQRDRLRERANRLEEGVLLLISTLLALGYLIISMWYRISTLLYLLVLSRNPYSLGGAPVSLKVF